MSNWKAEVLNEYSKNPEKIGREAARKYGVSWSSLWDFKQKILSGEVVYDEVVSKPKILLFDIETAPLLVHNWSLWQNFTSLNQIQNDWFMLSWAAKWLDEDEIYRDNLPNHPKTFAENPSDDLAIVQSLYDMINEADFVIGHNLKKFDNKKSKARFLKHGFVMPEPYRMIDTLDIAKREFALTSNKLDWLATYLGFENKVAHEGHGLWVKCMAGDEEAWNTMIEYNDHDVTLLEDVYKEIRGWSTNHPNLAVYYNDARLRCGVCGSDDMEPIKKTVKTNLSEFKAYRCGCCGKVGRDGTNLLSKTKRSSLIRNIT